MKRPWMPLYVADYLADTTHLRAAESGAYLHLIMHYWQHGSLPKDDRKMAAIAKMAPAEWKRACPTLYQFFQPDWTHKRIDIELAKAADISSKRAASAKQRHSKTDANAQQLDTHSHSQRKKEEEAPDGASSRYEFESGVIKLVKKDFDLWQASFSHLDLRAELIGLTQWAGEQRSWFNAVSGALAKRNREAKAAGERLAAQGGPQWLDGIPGVI